MAEFYIKKSDTDQDMLEIVGTGQLQPHGNYIWAVVHVGILSDIRMAEDVYMGVIEALEAGEEVPFTFKFKEDE